MLGSAVPVSRSNVTVLSLVAGPSAVLTEPVTELAGVGRPIPMRNVEWNQRYSGGPAELPLMVPFGAPRGLFGVWVIVATGCGRMGAPCHLGCRPGTSVIGPFRAL